MPRQLTHDQYKALLKALCSAFYSLPDLKQMVYFSLEKSLDEIASSVEPLPHRVFELIRWADSQGKIELLIAGACEANPGNPQLRAFAEQFRLNVRPSPHFAPSNRSGREHPFPETWKCDLSMIEDCVEALDQPGALFGFAVSCNYDAFRESFSKRLEHVLGRGKLDVIAPFTLSRLDTTDTVLKHASRMELLKGKLQYRDLLCSVKLASDSEQIVAQQAKALWQSLRTAFQGSYDHRLIVALFTQVEFELPRGIIRLDPPRFRPAHVFEWVQDFAPALGWEDHVLMSWKRAIIENSIVHPTLHSLDVELVYAYLSKSLNLLRRRPPPSPGEFLAELF